MGNRNRERSLARSSRHVVRELAAVLASVVFVSATARAQAPSMTAPPPQPPPPGVVIVQEPATPPPMRGTTPAGYAPNGMQQNAFVPTMQTRRTHLSPFAAASLSVFGAACSLSFVSGTFAVLIGAASDDECEHCRPVGRWLFLPLAGPFVSMTEAGTREARVYCGILGAAQVLSFTGFAISALVGRDRANRPVALSVGPGTFGMRLRF